MKSASVAALALVVATALRAATPQEAELQEIERLAVMVDCAHTDAHGVGFIVAVEGDRVYIATAGHVVLPCVKESLEVEVRFAGSQKPVRAEVLKYEVSPVDLGVLRVSGVKAAKFDTADLPFARLGDDSVMARGDSVFALGREWITNVAPERIARKEASSLFFQSNSARPGSSGGPLLNDRWQIVGMVRDIGPYAAEAIGIRKILATLKGWKYPVAFRSLPSVSAGGENVCMVRSSGSVRCWHVSEIGPGAARGFESEVVAGLRFKSVSVGIHHFCGIAFDGAGYCWGSNENGRLGSGSTARESESPALVLGGLKFASIAAGAQHSCGLNMEGRVYCWGGGGGGSLGNDSSEDSAVPVLVAGGLTCKSISVGMGKSCAVTTDGRGYCWGGALYGADLHKAFVPMAIPGKLVFKEIHAGSWEGATCGLTAGGAVYCWGYDDEEMQKGPLPVRLPGQLVFKSIHQGTIGSGCGLTSDGTAYCWGSNVRGTLGDGSTKASDTPVRVSGGLKFVSVSVGHMQSCGVTVDGHTYCWGVDGVFEGRGSRVPVRMADAD